MLKKTGRSECCIIVRTKSYFLVSCTPDNISDCIHFYINFKNREKQDNSCNHNVGRDWLSTRQLYIYYWGTNVEVRAPSIFDQKHSEVTTRKLWVLLERIRFILSTSVCWLSGR